MSTSRLEGRGFVVGSVAGIGAWLLGYVFTYLLVAPDIRDSGLSGFIEAVQGDPATYELVGWVFYNAHLVETVFSNVPVFGTSSRTFLGGEDGFTVLLYLIPIALLLAAGLAMARYRGTTSPSDGAVAGLAVVPGYFVAVVVGTLLFRVSVGDATGAPDALTAVVLAGVIYPAVFGGIGGALAAVLPT